MWKDPQGDAKCYLDLQTGHASTESCWSVQCPLAHHPVDAVVMWLRFFQTRMPEVRVALGQRLGQGEQ
jgi:hypothetical protein